KAKNKVDQDANSSATSAPGVQSNVNAPVRVDNNGNNGDVNQSNGSTANSSAKNKNDSAQGIDQDQSSGQSQKAEQEPSSCCGGGCGDPQRQKSRQKESAKNSVDQDANSSATSAPGVQTNVNEPVTVASNDCKTVCAGGSSGNVDQSNSSTASSRASNKNESWQGIEQDQGSTQSQGAKQEGSGCCGGSSGNLDQSQTSKQKEKARSSVDQDANSTATSAPGVQSNVNAPVTVSDTGCCSGGSSGDVDQSNS